MDKTRNLIYNHFYFQKENSLNLNINTGINHSYLSISMWIPIWKTGKNDAKSSQGKIDQNSLYKKIFNYKQNLDELTRELLSIFNDVNLTFDVSLNIKQYEHIKKSKKKAQGMQKGLSSEIIKVSKGSSLIFNVSENDRPKILIPVSRLGIFMRQPHC